MKNLLNNWSFISFGRLFITHLILLIFNELNFDKVFISFNKCAVKIKTHNFIVLINTLT